MSACLRCDHDEGDHAMIPTGPYAVDGGVMLCPVKGCDCYATWDVPPFSTRETIREPDLFELDELRTRLQSGDL